MDFVEIKEKINRSGVKEIYPIFKVKRSKDLMVRGNKFYAIWDDKKGMWSTDEYDVQRLIDEALVEYNNSHPSNGQASILTLGDFSTDMWTEFKSYVSHQPDSFTPLDEHITFSNTEIKRHDYVSKRLPYPLEAGSISAYDELIGTLYSQEERDKLEWSIGAIISGEAKNIQKFIVLYGEAGTGKSTVINIIQQLFTGYYTTFEAKALTTSNNQFATEVFKDNPLVAIQHDGDLSRIEDNTKLNSIVSHEVMSMQEKYKSTYMMKTNCFLYMGTNKPVKITDAKSGIIRRLIDVRPTGNKVPPKKYQSLISQIDFELGAIAKFCLDKFNSMGKNYYSNYKPLDMIYQTDVFFNFVETNYHMFKENNGITLTSAYELYKQYCDESLVDFKLPRHKFREELKSYFEEFHEMTRIDNKQIRSYYKNFLQDKFVSLEEPKEVITGYTISLEEQESLFDTMYSECKAQYTNDQGTPLIKWDQVKTTLKSIDTKKLHYVKPPINHIVIDFDIKDDKGEKSLSKNLEAASSWPPTYTEISKGGNGLHLHYIYEGDPETLSKVYGEHIEIKVFSGNSSLRRKVSKCNSLPIRTINSGLPLKGEKMVNFTAIANEKALRTTIKKNLKKEIHASTKPSMDFIFKVLEDAYTSGMAYDVTDMRQAILNFAMNSSNQADYCISLVPKMKFKSEEASDPCIEYKNDKLVFFDVEVFPNLFVVVYKMEGSPAVKLINPTPTDIEFLLQFKLVGFNCRRYDNHILYARLIGYTNEELFRLSQRIVNNSKNCMFSEAYGLSYTDVYDFATEKQSLKKWEIELGIHHQELGLPWDQTVPEKLWPLVADYCVNDVVATEAVFNHLKQDFVARLIIAELSGLTPNDSTQSHTAKFIFGNDPHPQDKFIYTDLSIEFPGYHYDKFTGKSTYRGVEVGEGGYVEAKPGIHEWVALLDVESMHPTSADELQIFGPYTARYIDLLKARLAIKHKNYELAATMFNGILAKYLGSKEDADALSYALKIVINIVYGLTAATFDCKFKDPRNIDNIVAKRGALFMIDLKFAVEEQGYTVAHIKTDSIKIPNADKYIIDFVYNFGKKYGYNFEHEATYEKMCLVNDAVYIAKVDSGKHAGEWSATGAQFKHPYVYKTLFSKERIEFKDLCETKTVKTAMYLNINNDSPENYQFVGKAGSFCPMTKEVGGQLLREKDGKYHAVTGTKDYLWLEAEYVQANNLEKYIDMTYFNSLIDAAVDKISQYGDIEWFIYNSYKKVA